MNHEQVVVVQQKTAFLALDVRLEIVNLFLVSAEISLNGETLAALVTAELLLAVLLHVKTQSHYAMERFVAGRTMYGRGVNALVLAIGLCRVERNATASIHLLGWMLFGMATRCFSG